MTPPVSAAAAAVLAAERFLKLFRGHWLDSLGNSIIVSKCSKEQELTVVLTPMVDHPEAKDKVVSIVRHGPTRWRCANALLEYADEQTQRLVWVTEDGRRSVWSRSKEASAKALHEVPSGQGDNIFDSRSEVNFSNEDSSLEAFPWLLNNASPEPWLPLDMPRDILHDAARIAALLDIRQLIGARTEPQERLTHILMDHDLHPNRQNGDYLIPSTDSPLWQTLQVSESLKKRIAQRISQVPHEALSQQLCWNGDSEVWVGRHKISVRQRDVQILAARWVPGPKEDRKPLEIARLLALYSVFDNPLSNRRNGVHLGLDPQIRRHCDFELFASPLNAAVPNGHFSSKWPHVEWRFGSIGSYPSVIDFLPVNSVVCINPPFTEAYLADVMARLAELKLRFLLRIAVPILEVPWRKKLQSSLPSPQLLSTYYDATAESPADVLHPTLLWEDPRCPPRPIVSSDGPDAAGISSPSIINHLIPQSTSGGTIAMMLPGVKLLQPNVQTHCVNDIIKASSKLINLEDKETEDEEPDNSSRSRNAAKANKQDSPPLNPQEWPSLDDMKDKKTVKVKK